MTSVLNFYRSGKRTDGDRLRPFVNACRRLSYVARDGELVDDVAAARDVLKDIETIVAQARVALRRGGRADG